MFSCNFVSVHIHSLHCIFLGDLTSLKYCAEKGVKLNERANHDLSVLIIAASKGHLDCVKFLFSLGVDCDGNNKSEKSALDWARQNGHTEIVKWLKVIKFLFICFFVFLFFLFSSFILRRFCLKQQNSIEKNFKKSKF